MDIKKNEPLAPLTSFKVGGNAEQLVVIEDSKKINDLCDLFSQQLWLLGEGTNVLISDKGLPGLTVLIQNKGIKIDGNKVIAESGTNWDELVQFAIKNMLWGIELMSGIPGSVGAAVVGNIAAYGQAVSDTLESVLCFDTNTCRELEIAAKDLDLSYRSSNLHDNKNLIVLSATFNLSTEKTSELEYQSALNVAKTSGLDAEKLHDRREIILKARENAGSLLHPAAEFTAGSFYKNPIVPKEVAEHVMSFEESNVTRQQILNQNRIHGGNDVRVSAAHVLLAAGFERGQTWGSVQLHPKHILKIVNTGDAKAQDIYNVHIHISNTVKEKLGIDLKPEVKFFGNF